MASWDRGRRFLAECNPLGAPLVVLAVGVALIRPWGNYPLNDDWQYAHVTENLLRTGRVTIDVPIAPSLAAQAVLASAWSLLVGFSHVKLRILTLALAVLILVATNLILSIAAVSKEVRVLVGLLIVANPLFMNLSLSFMTEIYGFAAAFAALALWLRDRKRVLGGLRSSPGLVIGAAALAGASFWTRQLCALVFLAAVGGACVPLAISGDWNGFRGQLRRSIAPLAIFAAIAVAYFVWGRYSGNLKPEFTGDLGHFAVLDWPQWLVQWTVGLQYLTLFVLPFLVCMPAWRDRRNWPGAATTALLVLLWALLLRTTYHRGADFCTPATRLCERFPQLGNVMNPQLLGPLTLSDTYMSDRVLSPSSGWSLALRAIQVFLAAACLLWIPVIRAALEQLKTRGKSLRKELIATGGILVASNLAVISQAFSGLVFDRYHLATFFGGILAVSALAETESKPPASRPWRRVVFALSLLAFCGYSIAGAHDYFRWNDARWEAVGTLLKSGVAPPDLDGGYEVNAWLANAIPASDGCGNGTWNCPNRRFRLAEKAEANDRVVARVSVRTWLRPLPLLLVLERPRQDPRGQP